MARKTAKSNRISIFVAEPAGAAGATAFIGGIARRELDADALRRNLATFVSGLRDLIPPGTGAGGLSLEGVEVEVGVDAKGEVSLLGTGFEAGAHASLRLQFKPK